MSEEKIYIPNTKPRVCDVIFNLVNELKLHQNFKNIQEDQRRKTTHRKQWLNITNRPNYGINLGIDEEEIILTAGYSVTEYFNGWIEGVKLFDIPVLDGFILIDNRTKDIYHPNVVWKLNDDIGFKEFSREETIGALLAQITTIIKKIS